MKIKGADEFNKKVKQAIENETYDEFLEENGFADAWEVLEHLIELLYDRIGLHILGEAQTDKLKG